MTVLTGPDTCSASESVINGLRGVDVEVNLIGGPTCGKPYGFYPQDNCGTTYFAIQFQGVNARASATTATASRRPAPWPTTSATRWAIRPKRAGRCAQLP